MVEEKNKLPPEERQKKRRKSLNKKAKTAGWKNWAEYVTAVRKGSVQIQNKPPQ